MSVRLGWGSGFTYTSYTWVLNVEGVLRNDSERLIEFHLHKATSKIDKGLARSVSCKAETPPKRSPPGYATMGGSI